MKGQTMKLRENTAAVCLRSTGHRLSGGLLAAGVALGVLLSAGTAQADGPTFVVPAGGKSVDAQVVALNPEMAGQVAMYPHVQHTVAQASAIHKFLATRASVATATIPYWTTTVTSPLNNKTYTYDMVGSSPFDSVPKTTTVTIQPIILKVTITGTKSRTLDPTVASACGDTTSVENRWLQSPLFSPAAFTSNGVNMGTTTLMDAFQRANFWQQASGTGFGIAFSVNTPIVVSISIAGKVHPIRCGNGKTAYLGVPSNMTTYSNDIQNIVTKYATPGAAAFVLTYNIAEAATGGGYYLGWHDAFATSAGVQTYGTGSYFDRNVFSGIQDVSAWTHEMGEWLDDPFAQENVAGGNNDNLTPAWGNVGQVVGQCQNNLEVGDPLSDTMVAMPTPAGVTGITYHQQDLTFHDWFYRTPTAGSGTVSSGTGGKYSMLGTFTGKENAVCTAKNQTTLSNSEGITPRGNPRIMQ